MCNNTSAWKNVRRHALISMKCEMCELFGLCNLLSGVEEQQHEVASSTHRMFPPVVRTDVECTRILRQFRCDAGALENDGPRTAERELESGKDG
jgi:hypothetical protein